MARAWAQVGRPERRVVQVAGDGGFMLNLSKRNTAAETRLPVVSVALNDGGYGSPTEKQASAFGARLVRVDLATPDFAAVTQARGIARWGTRVEQFPETFEASLADGGPAPAEVDLR